MLPPTKGRERERKEEGRGPFAPDLRRSQWSVKKGTGGVASQIARTLPSDDKYTPRF